MDFFELVQIGGIVLFLSVVVVQTMRLVIRKRFNPITLSVGRKGLLGVMEVALFAGVNLWIVLILFQVLPLKVRPLAWLFGSQMVGTMLSKVVGVLLIGGGFVLFILSLRALGDSWRLGVDAQNPGPLVTRGIYAFTRNPIYAFFDLYFVGTFLVNGHLVFLVFALLVVANLHYQILQEERFLATVHGPSYENYRAQVGRYATWRRASSVLQRWTGQQASD
jgi:protein-S-isoprenylcysteine O-methyltransferase Ste14